MPNDAERKRARAKGMAYAVYAELCAIDEIRDAIRTIHLHYKDNPEYLKAIKELALERGVEWAVERSAFTGE